MYFLYLHPPSKFKNKIQYNIISWYIVHLTYQFQLSIHIEKLWFTATCKISIHVQLRNSHVPHQQKLDPPLNFMYLHAPHCLVSSSSFHTYQADTSWSRHHTYSCLNYKCRNRNRVHHSMSSSMEQRRCQSKPRFNNIISWLYEYKYTAVKTATYTWRLTCIRGVIKNHGQLAWNLKNINDVGLIQCRINQ